MRANVTRTCPVCGREFQPHITSLKRNNRLYCSKACADDARRIPPEEYARSRYAANDAGCWIWTGPIGAGGYGQLRVDGKKVMAHRFFYEFYVGAIPKGMFVCHHCDNRRCVNPSHLFAGTQLDNMHDMIAKGRKVSHPPVGEASGTARLNAVQVCEIRRHISSPASELAARYGVSKSAVLHARNRRTWRHLICSD